MPIFNAAKSLLYQDLASNPVLKSEPLNPILPSISLAENKEPVTVVPLPVTVNCTDHQSSLKNGKNKLEEIVGLNSKSG